MNLKLMAIPLAALGLMMATAGRQAASDAAVGSAPPGRLAWPLDAWIETYINGALASRNPHIADHLKTITRLVAGGRYDVVNDELERLLGRAPKTVQWALEQNPRVRKALEAA